MTGLKVIKPGVLSTIQDWGRYGQRQNGLSTGGPIDEHAFLWANHLLGNPGNSATIEITVGLCVFESQCNTMISICGADMGLTINNAPAANWSTHVIKVGDTLHFRSARTSLRAYLAIKSGFNIEPIFGSCATVAREQLGGINGLPLQENDLLPASNHDYSANPRKVPYSFLPEYNNEVNLEFIPGYQFNRFEQDQQQSFLNSTFVVSQRMDRMGCQLQGEKIQYSGPGIISEGVALGSIQIPPDGQPIVLLKDAGSIGGYPKLGCVTRLSLNKLAQRRPGDKLRFTIADYKTSSQQLAEFYGFFNI